MAEKSTRAARDAKHGERMIEVKVRFWTDAITRGKGRIVPKHGWTSGVVRIERNEVHGIKPSAPIPFNSLLEIPHCIEKALIAHGIILSPSRKMQKYVSAK